MGGNDTNMRADMPTSSPGYYHQEAIYTSSLWSYTERGFEFKKLCGQLLNILLRFHRWRTHPKFFESRRNEQESLANTRVGTRNTTGNNSPTGRYMLSKTQQELRCGDPQNVVPPGIRRHRDDIPTAEKSGETSKPWTTKALGSHNQLHERGEERLHCTRAPALGKSQQLHFPDLASDL